jgi:hypothetical protein
VADEIPCGEHAYCPNCRCLHVDLDPWSRSNPHTKHTCERCDHTFETEKPVIGLNLPYTPRDKRTPYECWLCHAKYRARGSIDEGEIPVRNVCVCEVTATCDTCGAGFVVQRDVFDDREDPHYRCRACARGVVDPVLAPVARTGPPKLHDIDEHIDYYNKRDKRRLLCEACRKNHVAAKSVIEKNYQGYLFGCPGCGAYELVLTTPSPEVEVKKPSVHWRRRTRRVAATGDE